MDTHNQCFYEELRKIIPNYTDLLTLNDKLANSGDQDQMPLNAASDQGFHCLQTV